MKYKLINKTTQEEHLCDKVEIGGFDYYVSEKPKVGDFVIEYQKYDTIGELHFIKNEYVLATDIQKKVIATNNPNIDLPKVENINKWVNETLSTIDDILVSKTAKLCLTAGYNKSQETHPFSENDMIEFNEFSVGLLHKEINGVKYYDYDAAWITTKELLTLWKEQQIKTVYYE